MSTWTAEIKEKSKLDSNGYVDVLIDISKDDVKVFPDYRIFAKADTVIGTIQTKLTELKSLEESSTDYDVGTVITL